MDFSADSRQSSVGRDAGESKENRPSLSRYSSANELQRSQRPTSRQTSASGRLMERPFSDRTLVNSLSRLSMSTAPVVDGSRQVASQDLANRGSINTVSHGDAPTWNIQRTESLCEPKTRRQTMLPRK